MKQPLTPGIGSLKALCVFFVLGAAAHADMPYLRQIGPPPLRVAVVKAPADGFIKYLALPAPAATNSSATNAPNTAADASTNSTLATANTPPATDGTPGNPPSFMSVTPAQSVGNAFTAPIFALPTPDLLGISPEMLATYFRPVAFGTNAPVPGPFSIFFTPPLPPLLLPIVPDKSSHAEYIVK